MAFFSPPAHLDELSAAGRERWSKRLSDMFDEKKAGSGNRADSPRRQFFNPAVTKTGADAKQKSIFWTASPRKLRFVSASNRERWRRADSSRDLQDEYCEWAVQRNASGKIVRVVFTCEVPEYFDELARDNPQRLLELYHKRVGPEVKLEDLFSNGRYIPRNRWNVRTDVGPVHLIQANNNLDAAVELAAAATVVRVIGGRSLTSEQELIRCGRYGDEQRNSDPHIGAGINALARLRADVTLADPPALYISDFTPAGWTTPDGTDPKTFWRYTRGEPGRRLRGVYEVPKNKGYVVDDIKIRGQAIEFGAQIADFVSIKITGVATRFGQSTAAPVNRCV